MKGEEEVYIKGDFLFSSLYTWLVGSAILQGNACEGSYFWEKTKYFILFLRVYVTLKCRGKYIKSLCYGVSLKN